jgi:putative ABC transport system permease protein
MKQLIKIALRSIKRNIRRTVITIVTVCVGVFVIIVVQGFLNGLQNGLIDSITKSRTGQIGFYHKDYSNSEESFDLNLTLTDTIVNKILLQTDEIENGSKRLSFAGMISNGEKSSLFIGMGVEPEKELLVCPYLADNIVAGHFPDENSNASDAVITSSLAKTLNVTCGDVLTVMAKTKYGALNAIDIEIAGILTDKLPLSNGKLIILSLSQSQFLLQMDNEFTEYAVSIKHPDKIESIANTYSKENKEIEVVPWYISAKIFKDIMNIQNAVFFIIMLVLLIIVVSSIINTMLMSVYERVKEIGTMMAIGMLKRNIILLFLIETIVLGIAGGIVGLVLSGLTIFYFNVNGFSYIAPGTEFSLTIYPSLTYVNLILAFAFAIIASILSSFYPAYKAASLLPTEALRNN